jgi:hypothetical protein
VDAGDTVLTLPLDERQRTRWAGFEYIAAGVRFERAYALIYREHYGSESGPHGALRQ